MTEAEAERGVAPCEACGRDAPTEAWAGGEIVRRCPACRHLARIAHGSGTRSHPWGGDARFDRVRVALTARRLRRVHGGGLDVLEVGPGEGGLARRLEARGHRVSGVEPDLLERAGAWTPARGTCWRSPIEETDLPAAAFDLVVAIHVIEHLHDPLRAFAALRRALRPGGSIYLVTPNAASLGMDLFGAHWWNFEDPTHRRFFSPESLRRMLLGAGFDRVAARPLRYDSLAVESSSLVRATGRSVPRHGVLRSRRTRLLALATLPLVLPARALVPTLAPSFEAWARAAPCQKGSPISVP